MEKKFLEFEYNIRRLTTRCIPTGYVIVRRLKNYCNFLEIAGSTYGCIVKYKLAGKLKNSNVT